jgi:hypothetical protein
MSPRRAGVALVAATARLGAAGLVVDHAAIAAMHRAHRTASRHALTPTVSSSTKLPP